MYVKFKTVLVLLIISLFLISCSTTGGKSATDTRSGISPTESITVEISVDNDMSNRVKNAITGVMTELGYKVSENSANYACEVKINTSEINEPNRQFKFVRIELSAILTDKKDGSILHTWSFNQREGHTSLSEAENRAYNTAVSKIVSEYKEQLKNLFSLNNGG